MTEARDIGAIVQDMAFLTTDKELRDDYQALAERVVGLRQKMAAGQITAENAPGVAIDVLVECCELAVKAAKNANHKQKLAESKQHVVKSALATLKAEKERRRKAREDARKELEQTSAGSYAADLLLPR